MLGEGTKLGDTNGTLQHAVESEELYPYLWDPASKNWSTSKTVQNVFVMGSGGLPSGITLFHNEKMTAYNTLPAAIPGFNPRMKQTIGPELGIGFALGSYTDDAIMTLKSCIGDRALGWDLLPPGTPRSSYVDSKNVSWTYAGYHDFAEKWQTDGPLPKPINWAAGIQYDGDIYRANMVLGNLSTFYPGAKCYEVAGFFWLVLVSNLFLLQPTFLRTCQSQLILGF